MNRDAAQQLMLSFSPASSARDPITSIMADERITASGRRHQHTQLVAAWVKQYPGRTAVELWRLSSLFDRHEWSRRLPDAERIGLVRKGPKRECSVNRTLMVTWEAAAATPTGETL